MRTLLTTQRKPSTKKNSEACPSTSNGAKNQRNLTPPKSPNDLLARRETNAATAAIRQVTTLEIANSVVDALVAALTKEETADIVVMIETEIFAVVAGIGLEVLRADREGPAPDRHLVATETTATEETAVIAATDAAPTAIETIVDVTTGGTVDVTAAAEILLARTAPGGAPRASHPGLTALRAEKIALVAMPRATTRSKVVMRDATELSA